MKKSKKWLKTLSEYVFECWQHHAPCEHIDLKIEWNDETQCWHLFAAPILQEVLGGENDGKYVWAGYVFDIVDFGNIDGIWIQEQALMSFCKECNEIPKTVIVGKFQGHQFYLHLLLEPHQESSSMEIIDTIKDEIRIKEEVINE